MKIAIVTDAWHPQENGVVRVLATLERERHWAIVAEQFVANLAIGQALKKSTQPS